MKILIISGANKDGLSLEIDLPFVYEHYKSLCDIGISTSLFLIKGKGVCGYLNNLAKLKSHLEKEKIDIIHAHYGLSGMLSVIQRKVPVVITYHGSDIEYFYHNIYSSIAARLAVWNIFVAEHLLNKILIKPRINYSILPCGVDITKFFYVNKNESKMKLNLDLSKKYVLFSSSFDNKVKNYELAKKVMSKYTDLNLIELKAYSREEVNLLLNSSEFLLMTSFREGSPMIVKEAMACNCPIVSTNVGDVSKNLIGVNNCYITSFDTKEIIQKINILINSTNRTNGRDILLKNNLNIEYNTNEIVKIYYKIYLNKENKKNKK